MLVKLLSKLGLQKKLFIRTTREGFFPKQELYAPDGEHCSKMKKTANIALGGYPSPKNVNLNDREPPCAVSPALSQAGCVSILQCMEYYIPN